MRKGRNIFLGFDKDHYDVNVLIKKGGALTAFPLLDKDGNEYTTVIVGSQEWIIENLKTTKYADGSDIPNLILNGYDDWFLPSEDELDAMYDELHLNGVGGFSSSLYWSSTESNANFARVQGFSDGMHGSLAKGAAATYTRACRAFTSVAPSYSLRDIGPAGGLIFWKSGDDYLEAAPSDQSLVQPWSNITNSAVTGTGTAIGTGQANTTAIIGQALHTGSAALVCDSLSILGWTNDVDGAFCYYDNDIAYKAIYGALYNWYAVDNAAGLVYFERNGIQEEGWRVPTEPDIQELIAELGGSSVAGGKLKEEGTAHWDSPNTGATDDYGFKLLPSGSRSSDGPFGGIGQSAVIWTATEGEYSPIGAYFFYASFGNTSLGRVLYNKLGGMSVRCVRDIT